MPAREFLADFDAVLRFRESVADSCRRDLPVIERSTALVRDSWALLARVDRELSAAPSLRGQPVASS